MDLKNKLNKNNMRTIKIKNREYVPVVERVKEFHKLFPRGSILTTIASDDGKRVIVKATVNTTATADMGIGRTFTGYSQAEWGKGSMGDVALEVAETSAVGRALGFAGIGLLDDGGIASADEMKKINKKSGPIGENDDSDLGF